MDAPFSPHEVSLRTRVSKMPIFAAVIVAIVALAAASAALVRAPEPLTAVPETKTVLVIKNPPALDVVWEHFRSGMKSEGFEEGANVRYVVMEVGGDLAATKRTLSPVLETGRVDLVFTMGITATRAAKEVTDDLGIHTPVLFAVVSDPVGGGLVASLESSGNNMTGVTPANERAASKRLELLQTALPDIKRIVYGWNDEKTAGLSGLRTITPSLGLELVERKVVSAGEMRSFLRTFTYDEGDAILRASDGIGAATVVDAVAIAREKKVPLVGTNSGDAERGAFMSYGADYAKIGVQAARLAGEILRGVQPSDIPIEEAVTFETSVNTATARAIGIELPQSFLLQVSHVYEN